MIRLTLSLLLLVTSCSHQPSSVGPPITQSSYAIEQSHLLSHLAYLSSDQLQGRKVSSQGSLSAQKYLSDSLEKFSIPPFASTRYLHPFSFSCGIKICLANNVIGFIKGKSPSKKTIIISAHYDHIGHKGRKIYNGADDNASGVVALLTIGELIAKNPLVHNTILLFTDAEEINLKGAHYFLSHHKTEKEAFILNINLDMLAGSKATRSLHYITHDLLDVLDPISAKIFKQRHDQMSISVKRGFSSAVGRSQIKNSRNWKTASDHGAFYRKGIPFIYYGVGMHENYHSYRDDYEHINKNFLWHSTNIIYDQIRFIDQQIAK